jgi:sulfoxide reductase heme-binding subunit YedZ
VHTPAQGEAAIGTHAKQNRQPPQGGARFLQHAAAKPMALVLGLMPFAYLVAGIWADTLGANPAETLIRSTGDWTLRFLLLTLAITPLREWTAWPALARFRRMAGLLAFFYACCHALAYAWLDMGLDALAIVQDLPKRPFILMGSAALLLMVPLAATSFNAAIRRLGGGRWKRLHRAVYAVGVLAILHFWWMRSGKNLHGEVIVHATILAVLLGWRLRGMRQRWAGWRTRLQARATKPG